MIIEFVCDDEIYMILAKEAKRINVPKDILINKALRDYLGME